VQGTMEMMFSDFVFGGEGRDIKLDVRAKIKASNTFNPEVKAKKAQEVSLKSFTEASNFQSSKAFDIMNPNRSGSVQNDNLKQNKRTADATEKLADRDGVTFVQKEIPR
jgi:hypothetical protein